MREQGGVWVELYKYTEDVHINQASQIIIPGVANLEEKALKTRNRYQAAKFHTGALRRKQETQDTEKPMLEGKTSARKADVLAKPPYPFVTPTVVVTPRIIAPQLRLPQHRTLVR